MMASEEPCKFYRGGHCKFGVKCEKSHRIETCDSFPCLKQNCSLRHPPPCKFFSRFGRCKFKQNCSYLHVINNFKAMEAEIDNLQKEVNHLKAQNETIKLLMVRLSNLENQVDLMKVSPCEPCDEKSTSTSDLDEHMVSTHEQILTDDVTFKCELCEYSSKSKKGVNIHKSSKHKNIKNNKNTVISSSSPENGKDSYFEEEAPINSEEKCDVCKYSITSKDEEANPSVQCCLSSCKGQWHIKCIEATDAELKAIQALYEAGLSDSYQCKKCTHTLRRIRMREENLSNVK